MPGITAAARTQKADERGQGLPRSCQPGTGGSGAFVTRASEAVVARELFVVALAHVTFLVAGAGKAERLHQVLAGPYQPDVLPAQIVRPADGQLLWLVEGER
jgi:hypothetical protein